MITKTQLLESLDSMPENLQVDQVIDQLIFLEKIQKGLKDVENGKVNSKTEARRKLKKWLK
jgi:hypothetical protein